jgi:hypothetical protein
MSLIGQIIREDYCGSPQPLEIKGQFPTGSSGAVFGPITKGVEWPQISEDALAQIHEAMRKETEPALEIVPAIKFLEDGVKVQKQRADLRDTPGGERSMVNIVKTFNALTGQKLTTAEGWEFLICLKLVRGRQGFFHEDDYTDAASYVSLLGEEESSRAERRK